MRSLREMRQDRVRGIRTAHAVHQSDKSILRYVRRLRNYRTVQVSYTLHLLSVKMTATQAGRYDLPVVNPVDEQGKYTIFL